MRRASRGIVSRTASHHGWVLILPFGFVMRNRGHWLGLGELSRLPLARDRLFLGAVAIFGRHSARVTLGLRAREARAGPLYGVASSAGSAQDEPGIAMPPFQATRLDREAKLGSHGRPAELGGYLVLRPPGTRALRKRLTVQEREG